MKIKLVLPFLVLFIQCFAGVYPIPDVSSICGPETSQILAQRVRRSQWKASEWLLDQKNADWGWGFASTSSAILSLQLANETWKHNLEAVDSQLSMKQLNIEMLQKLSHRDSFGKMNIGRLGFYAMALHATCHNISNFHGHSIVDHLYHRVDNYKLNQPDNFFSYSLALLALCSSGNDVPIVAIAMLNSTQAHDGCFYPFSLDSTSMAVMAMSCMQDSYNTHERLHALRRMTRKGARCIENYQLDDGGFSKTGTVNIISTALAAQALIAARRSHSEWRCEDALSHILNAQDEEGHFGTQGGTIQILPLLSNRHHGSLSEFEQTCPTKVLQTIPEIGQRNNTINVTIEISRELENSVDIFNPVVISVLEGESLYRAMERARQIGRLDFESKLTSFGNYVFSINGIANNNTQGLYWLIHEVDEDGQQTRAKTGTEGLFPVNGSIYHWIYQSY